MRATGKADVFVMLAHPVGHAKSPDEHAAIADAILRRDGPAARGVMRTHLTNSLARVRALATAAGVDQSDGLQADAVEDLLAILTRPLPAGRRSTPDTAGAARKARASKATL